MEYSDDRLNSLFLEHICGYKPRWCDNYYTYAWDHPKHGSGIFYGDLDNNDYSDIDSIPNFCKSADMVLKWLNKEPCWTSHKDIDEPFIVTIYPNDDDIIGAQGETFAQAAVKALLKAKEII